MRYLEHRRHSIRDGSGHLSQQGVSLARRIGATMGPFELTFTSPKPRAFETAIAMGFAVDEQLDVLAEWTDDLSDAAEHGGFTAVGVLVRGHGAAAKIARAYRRALLDTARSLSDGRAALIISHSSVVEGSVMACLPELDGAALGRGVGYCEGVRLAFQGDDFAGAQILRV
jgi:broad specificity phosphatase PhoE